MAVSTTPRPPRQRGFNWIQDGVRVAGARGPSVGGERERRRYLGTRKRSRVQETDGLWEGRGLGQRERERERGAQRERGREGGDDDAADDPGRRRIAVLRMIMLAFVSRALWWLSAICKRLSSPSSVVTFGSSRNHHQKILKHPTRRGL
jgi:hypothetical protein